MPIFEIIDNIDPFPFREGPGRLPIDDNKSIELMKQDLMSGKHRTTSQAAKAASECAKGACHRSTSKRLARKFRAAIRDDVISTWLQYYYLMFRLGLW